jgi:RNA polymerase sigma factor (sigma-70 family)
VDAIGFEQEFEGLFTTAFAITRRLMGNVTDAEDAAAEAVARTLVAWRRLSSQPDRHAWVARVATNVAIDQLRRRHSLPAPTGRTPDAVEEATLRMALVAALQRLPKRQRQVVAMRYLADLDEAAVARSLGISVNSVKKHSQRGVSALRGGLGSDWTESEVHLVLG